MESESGSSTGRSTTARRLGSNTQKHPVTQSVSLSWVISGAKEEIREPPTMGLVLFWHLGHGASFPVGFPVSPPLLGAKSFEQPDPAYLNRKPTLRLFRKLMYGFNGIMAWPNFPEAPT